MQLAVVAYILLAELECVPVLHIFGTNKIQFTAYTSSAMLKVKLRP